MMIFRKKKRVQLDMETEKVHSYSVIEGSYTWEEAKQYCEERGGYLATITSREEFDKIISMLDETELFVVWLGGYDPNRNSEFEWITGEPFEFT